MEATLACIRLDIQRVAKRLLILNEEQDGVARMKECLPNGDAVQAGGS
jgi:hypothetical protein